MVNPAQNSAIQEAENEIALEAAIQALTLQCA